MNVVIAIDRPCSSEFGTFSGIAVEDNTTVGIVQDDWFGILTGIHKNHISRTQIEVVQNSLNT